MMIWKLLFLLTSVFLVDCLSPYYFISIPNALLTDINHQFLIQSSVNLKLQIDTVEPRSNLTQRGKVNIIRANISQYLNYFVPFVGDFRNYLNLEIRADNGSLEELRNGEDVQGNFINETYRIRIIKNNLLIFGETNKPIYKPGEKIKFRFFFLYPQDLKQNLESTDGQVWEIRKESGKYFKRKYIKNGTSGFDSIILESPDNVRMGQWNNVSIDKAMNLSFQLTKDPVFGKWKIKATKMSQTETLYFKVKKYVLPRFVVDVTPPTEMLFSDEYFDFKVCSKYSTGKNMKATIMGKFCLYKRRKVYKCRNFKEKLSGNDACKIIKIKTSKLEINKISSRYFFSRSVINVTVTEEGSAFSIMKSIKGKGVTYRSYNIKVVSNKYFKPALPYFGRIELTRINGLPKPNTKVTVKVQDWSYPNSFGFVMNYTSDSRGVIEFVIPYMPDKSSMTLDIKGAEKILNPHMVQPSNYATLSVWRSVEKKYIQISSIQKKIKCPGTLDLKVLMNYNTSITSIFGQVFTRGKIVAFNSWGPISTKCTDRDDYFGHYKCMPNGKLKCLPGWKGGNCRIPVCKGSCKNGACIAPGKCICRSGWKGEACDQCILAKYCVNGFCKYGGDCRCYPGWKGYKCDRKGPKLHRYNTVTPSLSTTAPIEPLREYEDIEIFERNLNFTISKGMGPDSYIVIYFMTEKGEVVADMLEIKENEMNDEQCISEFNNRDSLFKFENSEVQPGGSVSLFLKPPGGDKDKQYSCAVRINDVALEQFGSSGNVNINTLIERLILLTRDFTRGYSYGRNCIEPKIFLKSIMPYYSGDIDSKTAFAKSGITVFTNLRIVNAPCITNYPLYAQRFDSPVAMPAPVMEKKELIGVDEEIKEIKAKIRDFFPESWIFKYYNQPSKILNYTAPDSITTWKANSYCMTKGGLWIAPARTIKVLLPFYADIYVPYSIKLTETLKLPVKLFNYLKDCYEIRADLSVDFNEIKVKGPTSFTACLCAEETKTFYFNIEGKKIGDLNVTVFASSKYSEFCNVEPFSKDRTKSKLVTTRDAIRRQLKVVPPGVPREVAFSEILCNNNEKLGLKSTQELLPSSKNDDAQNNDEGKLMVVPGSLRNYLIFNGDVLGQSFDNLNRLVRMPYGCGEQNMAAMVPSIYVLQYLNSGAGVEIKNTEKGKQLIKTAKNYIMIGIKRQSKYRHGDGSYSAFGESKESKGSTWLTAFVLRSFQEASKYVYVDYDTLKAAATFLSKQQNTKGKKCFQEKGKLFSSSMAGGSRRNGNAATDEGLLTAYVLTALGSNFTDNKNIPIDVNGAIKCVTDSLSGNETELSNYRLALSSYALSMYQVDEKIMNRIIDLLVKRATNPGGSRYRAWITKRNPELYYWTRSADIETTAYAYLSLRKRESLSESASIIYWLNQRRNSLGGFYSTQDTVVGLQALTTFASDAGLVKFNSVTVSLALNNKPVYKGTVYKFDRLVTRKVPLGSNNISYISLVTNGTGCTSVQVVSMFNVQLKEGEKPSNPGKSFRLTVTQTSPKFSTVEFNCSKKAVVQVCSEYIRKYVVSMSGMILVTIGLPSGWKVSTDDQLDLESQRIPPLNRLEFHKPDRVYLYYSGFSYRDAENKVKRCFDLPITRSSKVDNLKPANVRIADYYKPDDYVDASYSLQCKIKTRSRPPRMTHSCPICRTSTASNISMEALNQFCSGYPAVLTKYNNTIYKYFKTYTTIYYEWIVDPEPKNCSCVADWLKGQNTTLVLNKKYYYVDENLRMNKYFYLYSNNVIDYIFKTDITQQCRNGKNIFKLLSKIKKNFNKIYNSTDMNCPRFVDSYNLYHHFKRPIKFLCSNKTVWQLNVTKIVGKNISMRLSNGDNTMTMNAQFPSEKCYALLKIYGRNGFKIIFDNDQLIEDNMKNLVLNRNVTIAETAVFRSKQFYLCKTRN